MSETKTNTKVITLQDDESIAFVGDLHADLSGPESRIDDYQHTVITKLNSICSSCIKHKVKAVIFAGDMFSRITVPHECVNAVGEAFMKFKKADILVFSIVGNHDIARNNMERLIKSPLKTLFTFEVVEHINLNSRIVINNKTLITPVDYVEYPTPAYEKAKYNILVAHMFYNSSELFAAGKHNIKEEDVKKWGYDCMFLGHDHVPYPIMRVGKTDILRPGSVMRATSHEYNYERMPYFYILKSPDEYNVNNFIKIDIEAKPFSEVASNSVVNKKILNNGLQLQSLLGDLAGRISNVTASEEDRIVEIIKSDKELPNEVRQMLFSYFSENGISI